MSMKTEQGGRNVLAVRFTERDGEPRFIYDDAKQAAERRRSRCMVARLSNSTMMVWR